MKNQYFRIIELNTHQVLVQKDFDNEEEEDSFLVVITFFNEGVKVCNSFGYNEEEIRDETFMSITEQQVQNMVDNSLRFFKH